MAVSAFNLGGMSGRRLQENSGDFKTGSSYGGSCTVTAEHSGFCVFTAIHKQKGYFDAALKQNGAAIASGSTKTKSNDLPEDGQNNGFDIYYSVQYNSAGCSKAFKVKEGDVVSFEAGANGDSGDSYVKWNMKIWG